MLSTAVYIGGGFRQHQLLYMLPIVANFCKKKKIGKIIIEQKVSNKTLNHKVISNLKDNIELVFLPNLIRKKNFFYKILFLKNILNFLFKYFFIKREDLLTNDSWIEKQIKHSIWDYGIKINKNEFENLEFIPKLRSIFLSARYLSYSEILLSYSNLKYAFFQHFVYFERSLFANLRHKNVKLIQKTRHVFRVQKKNYDQVANSLDKKIFIKSFKFLNKKRINNYWKNFLSGRSKNLESKNASKLSGKVKVAKNVIFLHVFRDSPFVCIDKKRIFSDYFDWFLSTLKIIGDSNELWQIRIHPSSLKWGEDPKKVIKFIKKKYFSGEFPKNIEFLNNSLSNLKSLKGAKRVVTFSGNVHVEAACHGIKPIIISNSTLVDYGKELFIKPKSFEQYNKILLKESSDEIFRLNEKQINTSRRIIFLLHNSCNFMKELNSGEIFFNLLKKENLIKIYNNIYNQLFKNKKYLEQLSSILISKVDQSLNSQFIKYFLKN